MQYIVMIPFLSFFLVAVIPIFELTITIKTYFDSWGEEMTLDDLTTTN